MPRPRKHNRNLPSRLYLKGKSYWYAGSVWSNLGRDFLAALRRYAELEGLSTQHVVRNPTFADLSAAYKVAPDGLLSTAPRTQKDYLRYLAKLEAVFGNVPLAQIRPVDVSKYHRLRGAKAKVQANREKACLSLVWNWARANGVTDLPNPCEGIHRFEETGRDVYIDDAIYFKVWQQADWDVRDAMDLAHLTGQRPDDVLRARWTDVHGDYLWVRQGKTKVPLRVEIVGQLAVLLNDIAMRRGTSGKIVPLTEAQFDNRFEHDRKAAGVELTAFQFRDLRAKAGTETADTQGDRAAQYQLGHRIPSTTDRYIRNRVGRKVKPTR